MRYHEIINENLTPQQAKDIFLRYGATEADLADPKALHAARSKLMRQHHSDAGGSDQVAMTINAAYDTLKATTPPAPVPRRPANPAYAFRSPGRPGINLPRPGIHLRSPLRA